MSPINTTSNIFPKIINSIASIKEAPARRQKPA
jgi:hypothetical protein